jgi:hypothetical protein
VEVNSPAVPDSHLSFIFKEKQKDHAPTSPRWDFLSDENGEFYFPFGPSMLRVAGPTGSAETTTAEHVSPKSNTSTTVSIQRAIGITTLIKSHQHSLSVLFNPQIPGNEWAVALEKRQINEDLLIALAEIKGMESKLLSENLRQNNPDQNSLPSGTTRILGHGENNNDLWIDFFGEKLRFPAQSGINTIHDTCLGFMIGYDHFMSSGILTGAIGYDHCKITEGGHTGHGHEDQIFGVFQGTAYLPLRMYLGYSLYGSVNFDDFHRNVNTGTETEVAKSSYISGSLAPHIDFGYDWCVNDWFIVEPFISNDFVFNFQPSYSEHGALGFNQHQDAINSGLYAVKPGVNLYQCIRRCWGQVVLREEIAYERDQPMFGTESTVSIINVQNGISTPTGLRELNLFVFGAEIFAQMNQNFYGDILYRGAWGTGLTSNSLHLKFGYFF